MIKNILDVDLNHKTVLIRVDFNVPIKDGKIESDARIKAVVPTILKVLKLGAAVILISHLGRPREGVYEERFSLAPVAKRLSKLIKKPVRFKKKWLNGVDIKVGEVLLCENVRFNVGEKKNDAVLSKKMAALCDVFVNDAFATAHRCQASTCGIAKYAKTAVSGLLLSRELNILGKMLKNPERPIVTIIGGSKISTKLGVLESIIDFTNYLLVGGGIANTLLVVTGVSVGKSLYDKDLIDFGKKLLLRAKKNGVKIICPSDVVVTKNISAIAKVSIKEVSNIESNDIICDIGTKTLTEFCNVIKNAGTVIWNGPLGIFEIDKFAIGTKTVAKAIIKSKSCSVIGGGDIISALEKFKLKNKMSYVSTGGGAFLSYIKGLKNNSLIPAVAMLDRLETGSK